MSQRPRLGQHFLDSQRVVRQIINLVPEGATVVEIGPGHGALTAGLLHRASSYLGMELDPWLAERLRGKFSEQEKFRLIEGDFLSLDLPEDMPASVVLVGNVPYYISAKIVQKACAEPRYSKAVLMFQLEFAKRLTASPGGSDYGSLSIYTQYHWQARLAISVGRGKFKPPPRVDSAVVELVRREQPPVEVNDEDGFFRLVRACFTHRRKQLGNAPLKELGIAKEDWLAVLETADIERSRRPQTLSIAEYAGLYRAYQEMSNGQTL
jgi:16S rRNA (adenine1518-N6/adenine1519-N6)-dimethyltransferase